MSSNRTKLPSQAARTSGPFEVRASEAAAAAANAPARAALRRSLFVDDDDDELCVDALEPPRRQYNCRNYDQCLDLAAALNWSSFTCGECKGQIDESLYWRARQISRKDSVVRALCDLPPIVSVEGALLDEDDDLASDLPGDGIAEGAEAGLQSHSAKSSLANKSPLENKAPQPKMSVEPTKPLQPANVEDPAEE